MMQPCAPAIPTTWLASLYYNYIITAMLTASNCNNLTGILASCSLHCGLGWNYSLSDELFRIQVDLLRDKTLEQFSLNPGIL